jgi:flagellar assembly protein FliH
MNAADCRVEWADGGAERDSEWMWSQIEGVVQRFLSGLSVPMPPGAPAPGASTNPITE